MSDLINETKVPSIPSLDNIQDVNVRNVLAAMKELLEVREGLRPKGDDLDANVTFRDLYNAGFAGVNVGGQIVTNTQTDNQLVQPIAGSGGDTIINNTTIIEGGTTPDLTIPGAPSGLVATGTAMNVLLEWTHISDTNHSHIEVWRADTNNLGLGVKIGTSDGDIYADAIGVSNATRYYWIRAISKADIAGGYNAGASSGTSATTGLIGSYDLISVDGAKIVDASIYNAKIYDLSATKITSGRIDASQSIEVGTGANKVVIDGLGNIRIGATGYATGSGFWIGENAGLSKLYLGTPTEYIKYNGSNLEIETAEFRLTAGGNAEFSGSLNAASGTFAGALTAVTGTLNTLDIVSGGRITLGNNSHVNSGQTAYATGNGFWLENTSSGTKFSMGEGAAGVMTRGFSYNEYTNTFNVEGQLIATGNILNNAVTNVASAYSASLVGVGIIQSVGFTAVTGAVYIHGTCSVVDLATGGGGGVTISVALYRDSTHLATWKVMSTEYTGDNPKPEYRNSASVSYVDNPSPGFHTYYLVLSYSTGSPTYAESRSLFVLETRR